MSVTTGFSTYTGAWINWSRGAILGATLTLSQRNGSLLTAFLGIFVTIAGGACWRILSFLVHQLRAGHDWKDKNVLHHQQQVIFRNSVSSTATTWQMIRLAWNQRKLDKKQIQRNVPFVILALCNTLLFAVAGVFSSAVTKAIGSETLISSSHCGSLMYNFKTDSSLSAFSTKTANDTSAAVLYSRACYGDTSNELQCGRYPRAQLASSFEMNVSCPFQSHICLEGPSAAFRIRSGWIDTDKDLGINSKASDRLQYRKVTTCSVLHATDYMNSTNTTNSLGDSLKIEYYHYGPAGGDDFTYSYYPDDKRVFSGYSLEGYSSSCGSPRQGWAPIPELLRTDADVTVIFLAQGLLPYESPVWDPWFMATTPFSRSVTTNHSLYIEDALVRVLGCADQFQICTEAHTTCTPLTGLDALPDAMTAIQLNDVQRGISMLLLNSTGFQATAYNINYRGLLASDTLIDQGVYSVGLPNNQWTIEVTNWFAISMAKLQQQVIDFATGPSSVKNDLDFVPGPPNACGRQKIHNRAGYISFSMFGILIILGIGGTLILTSFILEPLVGYFRQRFNWRDYKRIQWDRDELLELQRPRDVIAEDETSMENADSTENNSAQ